MPVHPSVGETWSSLFGRLFLGLMLTSFALAGVTRSALGQAELPPDIDSDGVQTLTRGPVHEAFASPTVADPAPGLIIPKQPPADIKETPPEYQPEGDNVQWFPGYWSWDEDREDFIWISGAWRDPPPGRRWVPGYWAEVSGGYQWVAGFWIAEQVEEMEYLKPPPASLEQGPTVASPGDDHFYIPGTWTYADNDYRWSAGYWAPYREEWVYVQPHWVWTPRGCIYVAGYYDWRLPRRGQIFAPVFFNPVVYQRPTYFYTPRCVINTSNLFVHLWVRDSYCHYYFGNYYGPTYTNRHFTPWCNYNSRPRCYDPLLSYCNTHYRRQGVNYVGRMQGWHNHYVNHANERPPNTWRDQAARHGNDRDFQTRPSFIAQDLRDVVRSPDKHWKKQDLVQRDNNKHSIDQIKQIHKMRFDQEKVGFVSRDVPGRDFSGKGPDRDGPDRDGPGRDRPAGDGPGRDRDGNGRDFPGRDIAGKGPDRDNKPKGPELTLPGNSRPGERGNDIDKPVLKLGPDKTGPDKIGREDRPGIDRPGNEIAGGNETLPGKFKLPKPTQSLNKPKVNVPETPDKNVVSRPGFDRPGTKVGNNLGGNLDKPEDRNPLSRPTGRPSFGNNKPPVTNSPANTTVDNLPTRKPGEFNPSGRDLNKPLDVDKPKTPSVGTGNPSSSSALQDRLNAIRQQQQDAINKARDRSNGSNVPKTNPNVGGNNLAPIDRTPKTETPKVEVPKSDRSTFTRPPLSSDRPTFTPRNNVGGSNPVGNKSGGNPGLNPTTENRIKDLQNRLNPNRGGAITPKPDIAPRSFTPKVEQPRSFKPNIEPRVSKPTIDRTPVTRPQVQVQPRNNPAPRSLPQTNNAGGGDRSEKKRGR
ncbi:hypothetical protein ETAA8_28860 [Anatilimnocola aggregata]|uniref:Uncharacterized protein n=1 Tax=Anatilimnocola aggregata TaxID=2528021 RepID=A0A517YC26_9BACT|nr:YXWGXW repeat-containing protein [Anatilimnocola aggregata]QDU27795.1 hypothetical protein ETAA8_28860 [Anatilimnocola aggregata]